MTTPTGNTCERCGVDLVVELGDSTDWELENGEHVCGLCCAKDTRETCQRMVEVAILFDPPMIRPELN